MNEITLIVGKLGTGKSTLANHASLQYEKSLIITAFADDFDAIPVYNLEELEEKINKNVVFVSDDLVENEIAIRFGYELGNRLLVIDEAHIYQDSESFKKVMRYSRHKNIDVILISHSMFDFARLNRNLVHNIITFKMTEPYELSHLRRINEDLNPALLENYQFVMVQGDLPKWLSKKDLTFKNKILMLKQV